MHNERTRREFLARVGAATVGVALSRSRLAAFAGVETPSPASRVIIARDEALARGRVAEHGALLQKLLAASMQKLTSTSDAASAWRGLFGPKDRVGIKVNTLGLSTQPAVVDAIVIGLLEAGVAPKNIVIWDRFDVELAAAGFKINKSGDGVRCRGTDADRIGGGYQRQIESRGRIGSCFSRIVAERVDALISVPVLKDHNLAGVSLGLKNFFGAIHNPNKYHGNNCDPFVADVVSHRFIGPKWRLTVCDATRAQYHAGPGKHPGFAWAFGGLIVSNDVVAADAVAADLLEAKRKAEGLKPFADEKRPAKHIHTAAARGLGIANLDRIQRIEM